MTIPVTSFLTSLSLLTGVLGDEDFAQVIQADKQLNHFIVEHNVDAAAEMYSDDFILTTSSGSVKKKSDILKEIGLTDLQFEINETTDVHVRLVGNTAVLTGTLHQKGVYKVKSFDNKLLVTDTWVLVSGRWKLLAGHATLIKTS
jgi:hypothetical protein